MNFDKTKYRERRAAGLRGQDDYLAVPVVALAGFGANRATYRKRVSATKNYRHTKWKDVEEARRTKLGQLRQRIEQAAIERAGRRPIPATKL